MSSSNNDAQISHAKPHTIKKFELVETYITSWAQKLLQNPYCSGIIFIDCMCNSGVYEDEDGNQVFGTPIRVSRVLRDVAGQYPAKNVYVYLNDLSAEKTMLLQQHLPKTSSNFKYNITNKDANELLKEIGPKLPAKNHLHFFLFYDPYDASIDWEALAPFFRSWGEVLINHMVNDPIRAIKQTRSGAAKSKYEGTYLADFEGLLPCGSDRTAYEKRVLEIIHFLTRGSPRNYYIASFPFFNSRNSLQYDLVHCTSNVAGFKLFKDTAWKTFGGKSSIKDTHGIENQYVLDFSGGSEIKAHADEHCYCIMDVSDYLQQLFCGKKDVPLDEIWAALDQHPIFPSSGYKRDIKRDLKSRYGDVVSSSTISFTDRK